MEIVRVKDRAYDHYEELLLKREQFRKEAGQILISYTREFGDLINAVFEKKVDCIRAKKEISWCQARLNHGDPIDMDAMRKEIDQKMALYYEELKDMLDRTDAAKKYSRVTDVTVFQVKRIYRSLAKKLHPDIFPAVRQDPDLMGLWNRINIAYENNDLEELKELEVLIAAALRERSQGELPAHIPDIEDKIARLEKEISDLLTSEPYIFKEILRDSEKVREKRASLEKELEEYRGYHEELKKMLEEMLIQQGGHVKWRMN